MKTNMTHFKQMKNIFLLTVLLLSTFSLNAQHSDWSFGMQISAYRTEFVKTILPTDKKPHEAFSTGFTVAKEINQRFMLVGGLSFAMYGDSYFANDLRWGTQHDGQGGFDENIPSGEDITSVGFDYNYFFANARIGLNTYLNNGRFRLFAYPFLETNIYLTNNRKTEIGYIDGSFATNPVEKNITTDFRRANFSAGFGLGLEAALSSKIKLYLMPNTSYMLRGMSKSAPNGARYWSTGGTLGLHYQL